MHIKTNSIKSQGMLPLVWYHWIYPKIRLCQPLCVLYILYNSFTATFMAPKPSYLISSANCNQRLFPSYATLTLQIINNDPNTSSNRDMLYTEMPQSYSLSSIMYHGRMWYLKSCEGAGQGPLVRRIKWQKRRETSRPLGKL